MKIYVLGDGRILYAVATKTKKSAIELLSRKCGRTSYYTFAQYGYVWDLGQVRGTEKIAESPGVVFCQPDRSGDEWAPA